MEKQDNKWWNQPRKHILAVVQSKETQIVRHPESQESVGSKEVDHYFQVEIPATAESKHMFGDFSKDQKSLAKMEVALDSKVVKIPFIRVYIMFRKK